MSTFRDKDRRIPYEVKSDNFGFVIAAIDLKAHRAQIVSDRGVSDVAIIGGEDGIFNFLEGSHGNSLNLTTVDATAPDGKVNAVHSRHTFTHGYSALPQQYVGICARYRYVREQDAR